MIDKYEYIALDENTLALSFSKNLGLIIAKTQAKDKIPDIGNRYIKHLVYNKLIHLVHYKESNWHEFSSLSILSFI